MKEISLHILDIVQNSIFAGATVVKITIIESIKKDFLKAVIEDNGCGMSKSILKKVFDPSFTSREGKNFGLGLPLLKASTEICGGSIKITSKSGTGTKIEAVFVPSDKNCLPLGDISATMLSLVTGTKDVDFLYEHKREDKKFFFDTIKIKEVLDGVSVNEPKVYRWISEFISEGEKEIMKEDQYMKTIKELEEIRKNMIDDVTLRKERDATNVAVAMGTCGISKGAREITNAFSEEISKSGLKNVTVTQTACIGNCDFEPIVEVQVPGKDKVTYVKMTPEKVKKVVSEHLAKGNAVSEFLK